MYYVYVLKSRKSGKFYTGYTGDLKKRITEHNSGKSKYTRSQRPLELIYYEASTSEDDTKAREKYLKSGMGKRYIKNRLKIFLT